MAQQWWIKVKADARGPFSPQQIRDLAVQGKLTPRHMISRDCTTWVLAVNVKGLAFPQVRAAEPSSEPSIATCVEPEKARAADSLRRPPAKIPRRVLIAAAGGAAAILATTMSVWLVATRPRQEAATTNSPAATPDASASPVPAGNAGSGTAVKPAKPASPPGEDRAKRRVRLAIVTAVQAKHSPLEDLLLADAAGLSDVEFLDREHLEQVINEQKISMSGLTTPDTAIRVGQILSADALVLIEPEAGGASASARVKVVETRGGVRLMDRLASANVNDRSRSCLLADMRRCVAKLRTPAAKRRYVADVGFRCEEPSSMLAADARVLGVLFEQDLAALPALVMLERDQARQVAAEQVIAGLDPRLRSAAVVLDGGVRRDGDGQNLLVSIRIVSMAHEEPRAVRVQVRRGDILSDRKPIVNAIAAALESEPEAAAALNPADEAALLGERAEALRSHQSCIEAASLSEAAFALAPSQRYFSLGQNCYVQSIQPPPPQCDHLRIYLRANFFAQRYLQWSLANESHQRFANMYYAGLVYNLPAYIRFYVQNLEEVLARDPAAKGCEGHTRGYGSWCGLEPGADEAEVVHLGREIRRVQQEKWDTVVAERRRRNQPIDDLLLLRLVHSAEGPTPDDAKEDLTAAMARIDREAAEGRPLKPVRLGFDRQPSDRNAALRNAVTTLVDVRWQADKVLPLLDWLTGSSDPAIHLIGVFGKSRLKGEAGQKAAGELFDALSRQPRPLDDTALTQVVRSTFLYLPAESRAKWLQLLPQAAAAFRPRAPGAFIDLRPPGTPRVWAKYRVRPVALDGMKNESAELVHFVVDPAGDGSQGNESITTLWDLTGTPADRDYHKWKKAEDDVRQYVVTRLRPSDGRMIEVERFKMIEMLPRAEFAAGPGVMFFNPREHGLAIVRRGKVRYVQEADGLPFAEIATMAWFDGKLYLGAPGALARFDPDTMRCELLASSRAVAGRSELDGGNLWYVNSMLPDPKHHCLWVSIDTDVNQRTPYAAAKYGLWKYSPADGSLRKADPGTHGYLTWSDGRIFFLAHGFVTAGQFRGAYGVFDPGKEEIEELSDKLEAPDDITDRPRRALINGDIITGWRYLCTTNGSEMLPPPSPRWDYVMRFGPGVLTCSLAEGKMWYIDTRPAGEPLDPETARENGESPSPSPTTAKPQPLRTWHVAGTPPVEARFFAINGGFFILKKPDGGNVIAPLDRLSKADRDYVQKIVPTKD